MDGYNVAGRSRWIGDAVQVVDADAAVEQQLLQCHQLAGVLQIRQLAFLTAQLLLDELVLRVLRSQHKLRVIAHFAQVLESLEILP